MPSTAASSPSAANVVSEGPREVPSGPEPDQHGLQPRTEAEAEAETPEGPVVDFGQTVSSLQRVLLAIASLSFLLVVVGLYALLVLFPAACQPYALRWSSYVVQDWGTVACTEGEAVTSLTDCRAAWALYAAACGESLDTGIQKGVWEEGPIGCQVRSEDGAFFQYNIQTRAGGSALGHAPLCYLPGTSPISAPSCFVLDTSQDHYRGDGLALQKAVTLPIVFVMFLAPLVACASTWGLRHASPKQGLRHIQVVILIVGLCSLILLSTFLLSLTAHVRHVSLVSCVHESTLQVFVICTMVVVCLEAILAFFAGRYSQRIYLELLVQHAEADLEEGRLRTRTRQLAAAHVIEREMSALQRRTGRLLLRGLRRQSWNPAVPAHSDQDQCSLCMTPYVLDEEVVQIPCKHLFHRQCIAQWLMAGQQQSFNCPICRADVLRATMEELNQADSEAGLYRAQLGAASDRFAALQESGQDGWTSTVTNDFSPEASPLASPLASPGAAEGGDSGTSAVAAAAGSDSGEARHAALSVSALESASADAPAQQHAHSTPSTGLPPVAADPVTSMQDVVSSPRFSSV